MSETETKRETLMKPKLTVKDLGNPRGVDDKMPDKVLGTIIGRATGIKMVVDAKGEAFEAIIGMFEGTPHDPAENIITSSKLFLPGGFHEVITGQLKTEGVSLVSFAFEVHSVKATNAIGYSYAFRPIVAPAATDELAELRKGVADAQAKRIAAPGKVDEKAKAA